MNPVLSIFCCLFLSGLEGGGAYPSVIGHMGLELATVIGQELEYSLDKKKKKKNVSNSIFQLFCVNNSLNSL